MRKWAAALAMSLSLTALSPETLAGKLGGISVEDTAQVEGAELHLNGMAIRSRYMVSKIYVAALYTQQKASDGEAVLNAATPQRMHLTLLRKMEAEKLYKSFVADMQANSSPAEMAALTPKLAEFSTLFTPHRYLDYGDVVVFDFLPGKGVLVAVKSKVGEIIPGDDFSKALLRIWFGKKPQQKDMRRQLLGI